MGNVIENRFLFNFAASRSEGGYKRLYEYAKWFNGHGGAWFAIHPLCAALQVQFRRNRFFIVRQSNLQRLFDDWTYLRSICSILGQPDLYYSYGIPLYYPVGRVNWSHLNNVLTLGTHSAPLSPFLRLKLRFLGLRMRRGFAFADVVSAESRYSLGLLRAEGIGSPFLSVNGSDDELTSLRGGPTDQQDNVATVVGTYSYKALGESYRVFQMLKKKNRDLKLMIIGNPGDIPRDLRRKQDVIVRGVLGRPEVIGSLRRSRYYISTTHVENSYNCASEGVFLAAESYISAIGPHWELLAGESFEQMSLAGVSKPLLHVSRAELSGLNLSSWDGVVGEMIARTREALDAALSRNALTLQVPHRTTTGGQEQVHVGGSL